jgi:hypothetical protein
MMSHGGGGTPVTGGATCEPRRPEDRLTEEAETRRRGWLGLPVVRR